MTPSTGWSTAMPEGFPHKVSDGGVVCLHADAEILILDKPAGLLCVPGRGPEKQDCLSRRTQQLWPGALIVHRLDQATSGLVLMARNPEAQRRLGRAFELRQVHKRYQAIVAGSMAPRPPHLWDTIDLPIAADWERRPLRIIDPVLGKPSLTRWRVLAHHPDVDTTRVELEPMTGRTHQLRVHLAAVGHPILGDALYADAAAHVRAPRLLLHAARLAFQHPGTGQWLEASSPLPF